MAKKSKTTAKPETTQSVYEKIMKNHGAQAGTVASGNQSTSQGKTQSLYDSILNSAQKREKEKVQQQERAQTQKQITRQRLYLDQYNSLVKKVNNGKYDASQVESEANKLIGLYKNYFSDDSGKDMLSGLEEIRKTAKRSTTSSGILPEEADAMRKQRDAWQTQLDAIDEDALEARLKEITFNKSPSEYQKDPEYVKLIQEIEEAAQKKRTLGDQIEEANVGLNLYDRTDGFRASRIDTLKEKEGFATSRETWNKTATDKIVAGDSQVSQRMAEAQQSKDDRLSALTEELDAAQAELDAYLTSEEYQKSKYVYYGGVGKERSTTPDRKEKQLRKKVEKLKAQISEVEAETLPGEKDTYLELLTEKMDALTRNRTQEEYGNDPEYQAALSAYEQVDEAYALGDYLNWYNGLDADTQERLLEGRFNAQDPRNREIVRSAPDTMGKHWERMTEDEINAYYYIANTEGQEAAKEFLDELQITLDQRHTTGREQATAEQMAESPTWANALRGVATVGGNVVAGPMAFASDAMRTAKGEDFNPYSNAHYLQNIIGVTRSEAANDIQQTIAGDGESTFWNGVGEVAANAYQSALSSMDSIAGMYTLGNAYTISMGMGATSSRMRELYESGATDKEIYVGAIGSGILEALFEKVSLDTLAENFVKANPEKWVKKLLIQAGVEGSEEFFTEISNLVLDAVNRGMNSDHNQRVRELMGNAENPMGREAAEHQAVKEDAMNVFWAFLGGVMSGGMSAVGGAAMDSSRQNMIGQDILSRNAQEQTIAEAQELRQGDTLAQDLESKQKEGTLGKNEGILGGIKDSRDATRLGRLLEQNVADMTSRDRDAVQSAVKARLKAEGSRILDLNATAEAITKSLAGEGLGVYDRFLLASNEKVADKVRNEIYSTADGTTAENAWVNRIETYSHVTGTTLRETNVEKAGREAMETTVKEEFGPYAEQVMELYAMNRGSQNRADYVAEAKQMYQAGMDGVALDKAPETSTLTDWQREIIWDMGQGKSDYEYDNNQGFATIKGETTPVNIVGVESAGDGKLTLRTDEGETVDAKDVTFGSYSQSKLYSVISAMGVDTDTANEIVAMSNETGLDLNVFSRAVQDAFFAGRNGIPFADIPEERYAMKLTQEQRKVAWQAGRAAARERAVKKGKRIQQGKHGRAKGGVKLEASARNIRNLNEQQKAGMNAANVLGAMGLDITVYASTEEQRAKGMENGHIQLSDGSIYIDLNAGDSGEGVMAWALSHEFAHFVEEMSPEKFQTFQEVLFEELGKNGQDVTALIEEKVAVLSSQKQYSELSEDRLWEIATSEVVAEMLEPMLTDTDAIARISDNLRQQDKGLWEKIKDWLQGLVEKLKNAYKDLTPGSTIAQQTRSIVAQSEEILNAWVEAATDAVVNYNLQDGQKNNTPGGVQYSQRYSYEYFVNKPDMEVTDVDNFHDISRDSIIQKAIENAKSVGHVNANGNAVVHVKDIGRDVIIGKRALAHGLDRRTRLQAPVLANVGNILSNSIKINELNPRSENIRESYILVGAAKGEDGFYAVTFVVNRHSNEVMDIDVLYAANVKKEPAALLPKITENTATPTGSTISIAKLLEVVNDLYPYILPEDVLKHFGYDSRPDGKLGEAVLYSQRSAAQLERENEQLRRDKEYLKELVKIQRQGNKDVVPTRASVNNMAETLKKQNGVRGNTDELAQLLEAFYRYMGKGNLDYTEMDRLVGKAADWLQEHQTAKRDPYAQEVLDWMKKRHVSLSQTQVDEIKYQYGSLREFQSAIKGSIIIDQKANTSLVQLWQEGASQFADQFDADMNEGDMPGAFADLVERLRSSEDIETVEARYYRKEVHQDLMSQVYGTYFSIKPIDSISDRMQEQIDKLKKERDADRKKYREDLAKSKSETQKQKEENRATLKAMQEIRKAAVESYRKQQSGSDQRMKQLYEKQYRLVMDDYQRQLETMEGSEKTQARVEGWRKTEERGKLQRTLTTLNKMMLNPTKTAFVPDSLQPAVIKAMEAVNNYRLSEEIDMGKIRELRSELDKLLLDGATKNQKRIQAINRQLDKLQGNYGSVQDSLTELKRMYAELKEANEGKVAQVYDEGVEGFIADAMEAIGNTDYSDLSVKQLQALNDAYAAILHRVRTANNTFAYGQKEAIDQLAQTVAGDFRRLPDREKLSGEQVGALEKFGWNNLKPEYAFERLGSATMTTLYHNLRKGEDVFYQDVVDARGFALGAMARHGYQNWKDQTIEYESVDGKKFSLNLEERMSLYAYSRRRQAIEHLTRGGIVLNENTKRTVKGFLGIQTEKVFHDYNNYRLSLETIQAIGDSLTQQQRAFAEEMQGYLSTVCADKNNEISRALYGVSKAKEKYYWPLKSSNLFSERVRNQQQNPGNRQKNAGHMKATTPHANNPVEVAGFLETWGNHVNNTAMYHAFTLPMEDFMRVYNFNSTAGVTDESIVQLITKKHGKGATDYIDQFLKDLNGGVRADPRETIASSLTSKFKKGAVSASLSVAIQQPSAVGRAFAVIDHKYFRVTDWRYYATSLAGEKAEKTQARWEEMKQNAPVVGIKEMGRFDVNMGRSTVDFITGAGETGFMATVDKISGYLPEKMDQATWMMIYNAAERQCKGQGYTGDALKAATGELFTEAITKTQVYDSVFSRSGNMRSKHLYMNMATSFMAEPTTTANMFMSAMADLKNKDFKAAKRKVSSIAAATVLNAILASFIYAARDDDEDKPYKEKYMTSLTSELVDSLNPMGYVPVVKDIWSLFQGYDVGRSDMTLWSEAAKALKRVVSAHGAMGELDEDDADYEKDLADARKKVAEAWVNAVGAVCNLFGLPVKNVLRDVKAILYTTPLTVKEDRGGDWTTAKNAMWEGVLENLPEILPTNDSKSEELYKAMTSGSQVWANRMRDSYSSDKAYESAVRGSLREYDKRIRQAAKALSNDADSGEYKRIVDQILSEGHFTREQVEKAIQAEARAISGSLSGQSTQSIEKFIDLYEDNLLDAEQYTAFLEYRDAEGEDGKKIHHKDEMIVYIGSMKVNAKAKDTLYNLMGYPEKDLERMPWHTSGYSLWEARVDNPALADYSDSAVETFLEIRNSQITVKVFTSAYEYRHAKDSAGKQLHSPAEIMAYIDNLNLSRENKDELYLAMGYKESTLNKTPWN